MATIGLVIFSGCTGAVTMVMVVVAAIVYERREY